MSIARVLKHLFCTRWAVRRHFTPSVLADIEAAIRDVESRNSGEIRFVIEAALDGEELWRGLSPRARALQLFGHLGVWDTANNNGVLIYVLFADRDVEIVADRGIAARVAQSDWEQVCREIEAHYRAGRFAQGSVAGIRAVGTLLERHFPGQGAAAEELPNQPVLL
ncbi:MAG TPA: TPM domain-containing protein [Steroidobacteraceae bacterium]|nr:TPM domain-containing protein [Steroidobacteraceae bacterium]